MENSCKKETRKDLPFGWSFSFRAFPDEAVKKKLPGAGFSGRESLRAEPERIGANGEAAPQGEGQQKSEHRLVLAFFWCNSRDSNPGPLIKSQLLYHLLRPHLAQGSYSAVFAWN